LTNDYPQFLGPHRNGIVEQPRLTRDWKANPPAKLWSREVGIAWSGFAVAGNHAITQEQRNESETVVCYDLLSGEVIWSYGYPAHYVSSLAGEGPRATPTIGGKKVYALGSTGMLNCLDLESGKLLWSKDIVQDNQSHLSEWGMSCSPLVTDELVVVSAGGPNQRSLVAYRVENGQFVWGDGDNGAGYSSPYLTMLAGVQQILIFNGGGVASHALSDGKILWRYPWQGGHPHVSTPIVLPEDRVLISSGYGVGSELVKIKKDSEGKFTAARLWKSNRLKSKFANLLYRDGFIYGLDDGIMVCLDAATGELKWKEGRYGHGQIILVADLLLVMAESGDVVLLESNPGEPREVGRFSALKEKTWNPPALAGEYLLVRNDKEAACYRLPLAKR
jgi:outer membrane protein assembly factor BamB